MTKNIISKAKLINKLIKQVLETNKTITNGEFAQYLRRYNL